jgi:hypothetical protein
MNTRWLRTTRTSSVGFAACSAIALLIAATAPASAAYQVTLRDSRSVGASTTVVDGAASDADGLTNDSITITSLVVGGYTFAGTLATNSSFGGTPFNIAYEAISFGVKDTPTGAFSGTGTASAYASATGFTSPTGPLVLGLTTASFTNNGSSTTPGIGNVESRLDAANVATTSLAGTLIGGGSAASLGPGSSNSINDADVVTLPAAYALNLLLKVTFAGAGGDWRNASSTALFGASRGPSIVAVPEPATLLMWGLGALGCMALRFRRRNV